MKCERCCRREEATYRVHSDIINIKVCASCADEARNLGLAVEFLGDGGRKGKGAKLEPELAVAVEDSYAVAGGERQ